MTAISCHPDSWRRDFFVAMTLMTLLTSVEAAAVSFDPPIIGAVGNEARFVAIADLDENGLPDLLVTSKYETYVSVLLAQPSGAWGTRSLFDYGATWGPMDVGDLDRDGHFDVLVGRPSSNNAAVMKGDGHGALTFAATATTGLYPVSVAIGDLNADGWPDFVTSNPGTLHCCHSVSAVVNVGGGVFGPPTNLAGDNDMSALALGDFDEDGKLDIVAGRQPAGPYYYRGNGDGSFQERVDEVVPNRNYDIDVADLNEDGHLDLVIAGWPSSAVLLPGVGDGTFAPYVRLIAGSSHAVAITDFDGDGHLDVASSVADSAVIMLGRGNGEFDRTFYVPCGGSIYDVQAADMNLDGRPDLIVTYGANVAVLLNNGTPISVGIGPTAADFDVEGLRPSPATGDLRVAFRLSSAAPATLDLLDLSGRRIATREVGSLGAGHHIVTIGHAGALHPGVYWLQLRCGNERRMARAVVL